MVPARHTCRSKRLVAAPVCPAPTAATAVARSTLAISPGRCDSAPLSGIAECAISYHNVHGLVEPFDRVVTLQEAGEAFRRLRQRRGWTLEHLEEITGLRMMTLSNFERAVMTPRPSTLTRLETGLGWPPGTFARLASMHGGADALDTALDRLVDNPRPHAGAATLPSRQAGEAEVFESFAEDQIATLKEVVQNLPEPGSARAQSSTIGALAKCAKAQVLVANSWRLAAVVNPEAGARLLSMLRELEDVRRELLARIPTSLQARMDAACSRAGLSEALIEAMTGTTSEELWQIRTEGVTPDGLNTRIAAFLKAVEPDGP